MQGILGFLAGMASFHLLMGASMYWTNTTLAILAAFGAITGSAFLLKFPLLVLPSLAVRKSLFYGALAIGWLLMIWLLLFQGGLQTAMMTGAIYMIVVSGTISGFYIVWKGFHLEDPALKVKCIGGGCSILSCCFLAHLIVLTVGLNVFAKTFIVLAPVALIVVVYLARMMERQKMVAASPSPSG